ncbi:pentatricopeptide repeat-containing protein 1, mitochondrial [Aplochiton taeniatus]
MDVQLRGVFKSVSLAGPRIGLELSPSASTEPVENELPEEDFGLLSADLATRRSFQKSSPEMQDLHYRDDEDVQELVKPFKSPTGRRNTPYWYLQQCKKLIKENKLQEALHLFDSEMLKGERLQPEEYNYTVLIGGCGRAGHLKPAFKLYNDMKKRSLVPTDATYTALFNACAESRWKQAGLQRAVQLEQELRRRNIPLSSITYHALLKTHALTNHLQACLHTLKEMLQSGHAVTQESFHYLLMGCVQDKEIGFRLALQVWRQMLKSGIQPDVQNYNLLLRAARDCGVGDSAIASNLLLSPDLPSMTVRGNRTRAKPGSGGGTPIDIDLLERQLFCLPGLQDDNDQTRLGNQDSNCVDVPHSAKVESCDKLISNQLVPLREIPNTPVGVPTRSASLEFGQISVCPNLLDVWQGRRGGVMSLGTVSGASDRLALIGGAKGVMENMTANGNCPDIKTLSLLADTMEPGKQSLPSLLQVAKQHKIKLDVSFFNSVIRRAARARDLEGAKAVVCVMKQRNVPVDVQTYGCLALGCERQKDGLQLIKDMEEAGLRPNVHVYSALIGKAARRLDYVYLRAILRSMTELDVYPNEVIIKQLEFATQYPRNYDKYKSRNNYLNQIDGFRGYYQQWLRAMPYQEAPSDPRRKEREEDQSENNLIEDQTLKEPEGNHFPKAKRNEQAAARRYHSARSDQQK